jgi:hypothetical protein
MKKWWLEFSTPDGREWSGWINTMANAEEDFPETIKGTFWTEKVRDVGCYGNFKLEDGTEGYVICNKMCRPMKVGNINSFSTAGWEAYFASRESLPEWERFDMRIEDCLVLSKTYVDSYDVPEVTVPF